jgi:hypothetical protein
MDTSANNIEIPVHLRTNPFAPKTPPKPTAPEPRGITTRRGKIARLPRTIRETLNRRLSDGEAGPKLLAWLNAQPEVQTVLAEEFAGRPITEQNLSEWRQGGYLDWEHKEALRESLSSLVEEIEDLEITPGQRSLADRCAELQALALGRLLMAALAEPVSDRREQRILALVRSLNSVRRCDHDRERVRLQRERQERQQAEKDAALEAARVRAATPKPRQKSTWELLEEDDARRLASLARRYSPQPPPPPQSTGTPDSASVHSGRSASIQSSGSVNPS